MRLYCPAIWHFLIAMVTLRRSLTIEGEWSDSLACIFTNDIELWFEPHHRLHAVVSFSFSHASPSIFPTKIES